MRLDRFTIRSQEAPQQAQRHASEMADLARRGKLDPVISRDDEIRRVVQVLARRLLEGQFHEGDPVRVDLQGGELTVVCA